MIVIVKSVDLQGDNLIVKADMPLPETSPKIEVFIVPAGPQYNALVNRRALYGLTTNTNALDAILREHAQRLNNLPLVDHENPKVRLAGGHRTDVEIKAEDAAISPEASRIIWPR